MPIEREHKEKWLEILTVLSNEDFLDNQDIVEIRRRLGEAASYSDEQWDKLHYFLARMLTKALEQYVFFDISIEHKAGYTYNSIIEEAIVQLLLRRASLDLTANNPLKAFLLENFYRGI